MVALAEHAANGQNNATCESLKQAVTTIKILMIFQQFINMHINNRSTTLQWWLCQELTRRSVFDSTRVKAACCVSARNLKSHTSKTIIACRNQPSSSQSLHTHFHCSHSSAPNQDVAGVGDATLPMPAGDKTVSWWTFRRAGVETTPTTYHPNCAPFLWTENSIKYLIKTPNPVTILNPEDLLCVLIMKHAIRHQTNRSESHHLLTFHEQPYLPNGTIRESWLPPDCVADIAKVTPLHASGRLEYQQPGFHTHLRLPPTTLASSVSVHSLPKKIRAPRRHSENI